MAQGAVEFVDLADDSLLRYDTASPRNGALNV
jgi:hypothetical protein